MYHVAAWCLAVLLTFSSHLFAQPINNQEWNLNVTISTDAVVVDCSQFLLPSDVGDLLEEVDPINSDQGEFSQSMRAAHMIKMTLQPQGGTGIDNLATINGCSVDGTLVLLATNDTGDTVTVTSSGNIQAPGGSVTLDSPADLLLLILRGTTYFVIGGLGVASGGGGGGNITDATEINPFIVSKGGDDFWSTYVSDLDEPTQEAVCNGGPCSIVIDIAAGTTYTLQHQETPCEQVSDSGVHTYFGNCKVSKPIYLPALALEVDGTFCTHAASLLINGGPRVTPIQCADNAGSVFHGSVPMLGTGWDGGTVQLTLHLTHPTTEAITFAGDWSGMCRSNSDVINATWGTAVQGDAAITTAHDLVQQTSAAVTLDGTCAAGDHIFFRFVVDAATFSTNAASTRILGVTLHYLTDTRNGNDE